MIQIQFINVTGHVTLNCLFGLLLNISIAFFKWRICSDFEIKTWISNSCPRINDVFILLMKRFGSVYDVAIWIQ